MGRRNWQIGRNQSLSTAQAHIIIKVKKRGITIMEKAFEELQIKDDFMFSVIMRNPKFCKPFFRTDTYH